MFVTHFQIDVGDSIHAHQIKRLIEFTESRDWSSFSELVAEQSKAFFAEKMASVTRDAMSLRIIDHMKMDRGGTFVNCGQITDLVDVSEIDHEGHGLIVNTKLQIPSLFYVVDGMVRCPHINFDFQDYTRFEFTEGKMIIRDLTEIDKTMLRLASHIKKEPQPDGTFAERIG
jgi:hypothetical protein